MTVLCPNLCYNEVFYKGTALQFTHYREDHDKIEEQKKWLDCEVEKIVQQKREVEHLQEVGALFL